jgi:hypothetical protein
MEKCGKIPPAEPARRQSVPKIKNTDPDLDDGARGLGRRSRGASLVGAEYSGYRNVCFGSEADLIVSPQDDSPSAPKRTEINVYGDLFFIAKRRHQTRRKTTNDDVIFSAV